ncbi:MAG: hypothetical protein P8O23_09935, partial [Opitutales bacterium]|nr:hypothetical protein [Opitutales bacterium]
MKNLLLVSFLACVLLFSSCQNSYRQNMPNDPSSKGIVGVTDDAFQVTTEEYGNYFESRYGLLYQKFNDRPFTGRILSIEKGESGDYVLADESWREGKKEGLSARWFSNGIKMYERNYSEGRWHGTVTRWWPNGQKMYVRAYTNGTRHGKEATWRSDGSPIQLSEKPFVTPRQKTVIPEERNDVKETLQFQPIDSDDVNVPEDKPVVSESFPPLPESDSNPDSFPSFPSEAPSNSDVFPPLPDSLNTPGKVATPAIPGNNPILPEAELGLPDSGTIEFPPLPESTEIPQPPASDFPTNDNELPSLPGLPDSSDANLPSFPSSPSSDEVFPPLPGLPESGSTDLPSFPDSSGDDLPPLPGLPGSGGDDLPPLPGAGSDDLPPLPGFSDDP